MRTLVTSEVLAVIYLGRRTKTLRIYQLEYLGCPPQFPDPDHWPGPGPRVITIRVSVIIGR